MLKKMMHNTVLLTKILRKNKTQLLIWLSPDHIATIKRMENSVGALHTFHISPPLAQHGLGAVATRFGHDLVQKRAS